jgi:hypothetical protein
VKKFLNYLLKTLKSIHPMPKMLQKVAEININGIRTYLHLITTPPHLRSMVKREPGKVLTQFMEEMLTLFLWIMILIP